MSYNIIVLHIRITHQSPYTTASLECYYNYHHYIIKFALFKGLVQFQIDTIIIFKSILMNLKWNVCIVFKQLKKTIFTT